jgi:hypothetical protein
MTNEMPQSGLPIPDDDHVLRYIAPRHVENGIVNGAGFLRRPGEDASSVNWLEYFDPPVENQVQGVREVARLRYAKTGQLARLNIGATRNYVRENSPEGLELSFVHDPLMAEGDFPADPSHALIQGGPTAESVEAELIKDLIADCIVQPLYPAVPQQEPDPAK